MASRCLDSTGRRRPARRSANNYGFLCQHFQSAPAFVSEIKKRQLYLTYSSAYEGNPVKRSPFQEQMLSTEA
jgi:hypothetical protein